MDDDDGIIGFGRVVDLVVDDFVTCVSFSLS